MMIRNQVEKRVGKAFYHHGHGNIRLPSGNQKP